MTEPSKPPSFESGTALLLAVVLAGIFNVVGAVMSALALPSTISSLNEELAPFESRGIVVRESLWFNLPGLALGLPMAVVGLAVLRRSGRLTGVRWPTVVVGVALSAVVVWGLALLFIGLRLAIRQLL